MLLEVFRETEDDAETYLNNYVDLYAAQAMGEDTGKRIEALNVQIDLARKKKGKLLAYNIAGQITDKDFLSMNRDCDREIEEAEREIFELEQAQISKEEFRQHIDTIHRVLRDARRDAAQGIVTKEFVDRYIDKIFVTPEEDGSLRLDIRILTGESTQKFLQKLARRAGHITTPDAQPGKNPAVSRAPALAGPAGHTFKKMIESYENGLK